MSIRCAQCPQISLVC
ncbi:hypothetical protein FFJ24_018270 [Pedobacter sp. KBS0701]|uniref:Uncharacterized protein n=1 Tax=Pedobacter psychrodurus TaxID=2530456 RepID=A0A4R0Q0U5_9SPHI|nr:hypothetical protein FFJ24_018270 [Pedobacter sp. KBS0701]TCD27526.1 hypothetical protein EZ456_08825 [Pedobacter psychrodurus]